MHTQATNHEAESGRAAALRVAAGLFARHGYGATSMRDIAEAAGMRAASLYHHWPSKEALFVAVHADAMEAVASAVRGAVAAAPPDPWARLEAAAAAHCKALLRGSQLVGLARPYFAETRGRMHRELIAPRDAYERIIAGLVDALDLPPGTDRRLWRLLFLGALNSAVQWYRPDGPRTPTEIGRSLVGMLRDRGPTEAGVNARLRSGGVTA